jgi:hypothetical protein
MHPMNSLRIRILLLALLPLTALAGCAKSPSSPALGTMRIQMTDAPADYDAVNLVITQVAAHIEGSDADATSGWEILNADPRTYDLLTLRDGVFTTIGMAQIPAGHYTQIRLMLGEGSNLVIGGVTYPLTVPSGMQTGLKLIGSFDVPADGLVDVALDFDAARSIHQTGSGKYMLKPTVKVLPFSSAGAISGIVLPAGTETAIYAIVAPDTLGTAVAAADGGFTVGRLPAGIYSLALHPAAGYRDTTLAGVAVTAGQTTNVGEVQLTAN